MATSILTTKLHIPPLRRNLVSRQRLLERLDQGLHRRLVLVSAPAGYGKTTLLAAWTRGLCAGDTPLAHVAWLSLDAGDNDPVRFSAYLTAALRGAKGGAAEAGADTGPWAASLPLESRLVLLINWVATLDQTLVLILDDYHLITSQAVHDAVAFLVENESDNLLLVLATRADPPLPLPRLRVRGHLTELRQSDLSFTPDEAAAFLNDAMALGLGNEGVHALESRTEGWIAGLQMAALSLRGQNPDQDPGPAEHARLEFIQDLTGSHRYILDYLVEEVLDQQPPAIQDFLLKTSILERLTAPLCDWLVEGQQVEAQGQERPDQAAIHQAAGSQGILEHLEAANLFIVSLDHERRWFRYHRLFADLLRKRLQQSSPDFVPLLYSRSSVWHERQGLMAAAIDYALAARDYERAADLIEDVVEVILVQSEIATFLNWVERLPDESVRSRPTLCFYHAWTLLMSGRSLDLVELSLEALPCSQGAPDSEMAGTMAGRVTALRAYQALFQADVQRSADLGREALQQLPEDDRFLRGMVTWILSLARLSQEGLQNGSQTLEELVRVGQESGNPLLTVTALCHQAKVQERQGHLHQAREILERALLLAADPQGRRLPIASEALIGLGDLEREWNRLEAADAYLTEGIDLANQWSELAAFDAYFPLARVRWAKGDVAAALEALETAQDSARRSEVTQVDDQVVDLQQAHFAISRGDVNSAMRWARQRGWLPAGSTGLQAGPKEDPSDFGGRLRKYEKLVVARLFMLQGKLAEALALLEQLLAESLQLGRIDLVIQVQIQRALAFQAAGQEAPAVHALGEALVLAEPGGYRRIFLDEGPVMAGLLRQAASSGITPAYSAQLLADLDRPRQSPDLEPAPANIQPLVEPLSARELEVLHLLATGLSNPEIADQLCIAVSTVRSHCKSIYGKLGVHKRWDAVQRARELGLL